MLEYVEIPVVTVCFVQAWSLQDVTVTTVVAIFSVWSSEVSSDISSCSVISPEGILPFAMEEATAASAAAPADDADCMSKGFVEIEEGKHDVVGIEVDVVKAEVADKITEVKGERTLEIDCKVSKFELVLFKNAAVEYMDLTEDDVEAFLKVLG